MTDQPKKEQIILKNVEKEISQSYIDYSMSVIVSRALPDVRDWLKPVQRRILFAMDQMKIYYNTRHRKSATVVWEVLGKYHPHGDSSVYEAMVRMSQDFSLRYPLIDWQWNFWSIDGDGAAAMRYTEARLTKIAEEILRDLDLDTVEWKDNYDSSRQEPITLPTKFPNHLCNWTMWIAVWMATNMAPHNLTEVIDASLLLIQNFEATIDEIMQIVKWPDFPTGWMIFDPENIKAVYTKWKWSITVRGKAHFEEIDGAKVIVIDEIPYQVNKAGLVTKIWELVNIKKIDWITDITDESNKNKIKIVVHLRKWVNPEHILTMLYKFTELQTNFNLNNVALIDKWIQPNLLNIKDLLWEFVCYRREVVLRRSKFLLAKAQDRLHILEWLKKAIDIIDEVIATIRWSNTRAEAKEKLMADYDFSDPQSEYILMLRLQTLVWLEIQKIMDEMKEKQELIDYLTKIISDPAELDKVVVDELVYIKDEYGDKRKTQVSEDVSIYELNSSMNDLRKFADQRKENVILQISNNYETKVLYQTRLNAIPDDTYALNYTNNQDRLIVISENWELVVQRLKDLWSHNSKWPSFDFQKNFNLNGNIIFSNTISADYDYIVMLTNKNNIKKIWKDLIESFKKFPTVIMNLEKWEKILCSLQVKEWDNIWILTKNWMLLLFQEKNIRPSGKTAGWVKAISLDQNDAVANMFLLKDEMFIFVYSETSGKLIAVEDCKIMKRAQIWLIATKLKDGEIVKWWLAIDEWAISILLKSGQVLNLHSNDIRLKDRLTKLEEISPSPIDRIYTPWSEKVKKRENNEDENNA